MYRVAIESVGRAYRYCESLKGHRNAKDQLLRASQAIPLNRIVAMPTKLGQRGGAVHEDLALYTEGTDPDPDSDPDTEENGKQTDRQPLPEGDA